MGFRPLKKKQNKKNTTQSKRLHCGVEACSILVAYTLEDCEKQRVQQIELGVVEYVPRRATWPILLQELVS